MRPTQTSEGGETHEQEARRREGEGEECKEAKKGVGGRPEAQTLG